MKKLEGININSEEVRKKLTETKKDNKKQTKFTKFNPDFNSLSNMRFSTVSDLKPNQFSSFANAQPIFEKNQGVNNEPIRKNSQKNVAQKRTSSHSPTQRKQSIQNNQKQGNKQKQIASKLKGFGVGLGYQMATTFELYTSQHNKTYNEVQCVCDLQDPEFRKSLQNGIGNIEKGESCVRARQWLQIAYGEKQSPQQIENSKKLYYDLLSTTIEMKEHELQIKRDLSRTFPEEQYYQEGQIGQKRLQDTLQTFVKYDAQLGYVQGMNFIMGALLWHANEVDAFWLFVSLVEKYELRDIYLPGLPGLSKHCQIIDMLIQQNLPQLYRHLAENRVVVEMFATDWCFTLFGSLMPLQIMGDFFQEFYNQGWSIFYRLALTILRNLEPLILQQQEAGEIMLPLKPINKPRNWKKYLYNVKIIPKPLRTQEGAIKWGPFLKESKEIDIDERYIRFLHMNFNPETRQFRNLSDYQN